MASPFIFSVARGRWVEKFMLPLGTDNILVVLLKASGLQADATLDDHLTLASVLGSNTEASFTNYSRKVLSAVDITVSLSSGTWTVDTADQIWTSAGGASNDSLGALITVYRPTSSATTAQMLPLTCHPYIQSTSGTDAKATITSIGTQP